ncbi:hypothetical protein PsorP6_012798 [Peronosclerospora sorghi]|uniref:Uncharacterized protein n=1 Tax=Peronosclerospora sorghi TaxID=230839 RepID=A0ACC0WE86_9STRA|nr:hypothetical protein PsorP6_012798 [Peronosclerospora sorghi]
MFRFCDTVWTLKDRRVHRVVSTLLPQLADFCPGAFVQFYLDECIAHLTKRTLAYAAPASERGVAFIAMGRLALAVRDALVPHLAPILKLVEESLASYTQKSLFREHCNLVASARTAVGVVFVPRWCVLETMKRGGLREELIDGLADVVASVPSALP